MPGVMLCAMQTEGFPPGAGSWARFPAKQRLTQKCPDRFRGPVRDDCTVVDPACEFVQAETIPAEVLFERGQFQLSQITYSLHSKLRQLVSCNFADSRQASDRKRAAETNRYPRAG